MRYLTLDELCIKESSNIAQKDLEQNNGQYPIYGASGFLKRVDFYHQDKTYIAIVKDGAGIGRTMLLPAKSSVIGTLQYIKLKTQDVVIDYLYYAIVHMNLSKYYSGATIPHIYYKDYKKEIVKIPNLETQCNIVRRLRRIDKLKEYYIQKIELLDKLVKSRFIELFGEPGTDPYEWGVTTLGECCELNPRRPRDIRTDIDYSFVSMSSVSEDGDIDASIERPYSKVCKGFTYFAENDVLFAKITPCMQNGKGGVAKGLKNRSGFGSTEFHVLRPIKGISDSYWLYMITMFPKFRSDAEKVMTGTGGQRRVPITYLSEYRIALPPISLQKQFAAFVHQSDKSKYYRYKFLSLCRKMVSIQEGMLCQTLSS